MLILNVFSVRPSRVRQKRDFSRFKNRLSTSASATEIRRDRSNASIPSIQVTSESVATSPAAKRKSAIVEKFNDFVHTIRTMSADRIRSASQNRGNFWLSNYVKIVLYLFKIFQLLRILVSMDKVMEVKVICPESVQHRTRLTSPKNHPWC